MEKMQQIIGPFKQIVTLQGLALHGPLRDASMICLSDGGVVTEGGIIVAVENYGYLKKTYPHAGRQEIEGETVLLPGFVDAHTHICFAGNRARDYAMRVEGKSYLEIARAGGGITDTVKATRDSSEHDLRVLLTERVHQMMLSGITTMEVKTGYGLSTVQELKLLRVIKEMAGRAVPDIISTCLAAHMKPFDFKGSVTDYLQMVLSELLPVVQREALSDRVDIFVEESAFTVAEARDYLQRAKAMGFELTVHADQFTTGGALLAVEMGALSADHLEASCDRDIEAIAKSSTVATVLPGASLGLGVAFAPARKLLDAGACLAIASDWNPGSAPMGDLLTAATLLGAYEKLSISETFAGITFRGAHALGLKDRGIILPGLLADFQAFPVRDYREICYYQGQLKPKMIWKRGVHYDQ